MSAPIYPATAMAPACDISEFQETLRTMRKIDDNIIHALNTTIPTATFAEKSGATNQCQDLYSQLLKSYEARESTIKQCLNVTSEEVQRLKATRESDPDNFDLLKKLRKVQTKFRIVQNELSIEEVIKDRSLKVFYDRCRFFYKPPNLKA